ncbi:MAG: YitT family protein [Clostridiales bacterium]|nr:YitT family protein [Clostridiales bacterium]
MQEAGNSNKFKPKFNFDMKKIFTKETALLNLGLLMVAVGIHVFRNTNKFASGGISGLSLLFSYYLPGWPVGSLMFILNLIVLLLGYYVLGKESGAKSLYGTFVLSAMIWVIELVFPLKQPITSEKFLEFIFSVFVPGFGSALVFHTGASTGGTDIIAQIMKKFFNIKVTHGLMLVDFFIALTAGALFGVQACLYSVLGVCLKTFLMDSVLESLRIYKIMVIISEKSKQIYHYINGDLNRGATIHYARGAYTVEEKEVITTVLSRGQARKLQQYIMREDPAAFITISNSTEIIGKGFGGFE